MSTDDQKHDQQFFDLFMLVLGLLVGVTFGIFLLARYIASNTQEVYVLEDRRYEQEVLARIAPIGEVALTGEAQADDAGAVAEVQALSPAPGPMTGPQVYNAACLACHGAGIGGAPKTGDAAVWQPRIAKGQDVLTNHVLNGFQGEAGYMPPKGGRVDLSDDEILAAMSYMLEQSD